jgi:indole-3-glycerol phosphate synthase
VSDFLDEMARESRARVRALAPRAAGLARAADRAETPLPLVLGAFGVIAEVKPRAPSAGSLGDDDPSAATRRAIAYADGRAACVSVLTEPTRFGGSIAHLEEIAAALRARDVPAMRKDFLVDPLQVVEARAAGASGVLLVTRMLDDAQLADMIHAAQSLRLFVLVEAFDEHDLERTAQAIVPSPTGLFVGVNCRDLRTLAIDRTRLAVLARALPEGIDAVAESGIEGPDDVEGIVRAGYRGVLVGTALMRAAAPSDVIRAIRDRGRVVAEEMP